MSGEGGGAKRNPGMFMVWNARQALAPTEFAFAQRDEGFNGKALANHSRIGRRKMNVFTAGLETGHQPYFFEKGHAPTSEEAAIPDDFLW